MAGRKPGLKLNGQMITNLMGKHGFSIEKLASQASASTKTIQRAINGTAINEATSCRLADLLNVPIDDLVSNKNNESLMAISKDTINLIELNSVREIKDFLNSYLIIPESNYEHSENVFIEMQNLLQEINTYQEKNQDYESNDEDKNTYIKRFMSTEKSLSKINDHLNNINKFNVGTYYYPYHFLKKIAYFGKEKVMQAHCLKLFFEKRLLLYFADIENKTDIDRGYKNNDELIEAINMTIKNAGSLRAEDISLIKKLSHGDLDTDTLLAHSSSIIDFKEYIENSCIKYTGNLDFRIDDYVGYNFDPSDFDLDYEPTKFEKPISDPLFQEVQKYLYKNIGDHMFVPADRNIRDKYFNKYGIQWTIDLYIDEKNPQFKVESTDLLGVY